MKPTRYAYTCEECGHCVLDTWRQEHTYWFCRLCHEYHKFLLCSVVTDNGEYEEWRRI